MKSVKQAGFTAIEAIVIIVIVGALLGVGIWVVKKNNDDKTKKADTSQASGDESSAVPEAPTIESSKDLDTAEQALDDSNLDTSTSDSNELDAQTNSF